MAAGQITGTKLAHAKYLVLVKFEVKVRAGLNIARTSSSVDLTAGLGRDEFSPWARRGFSAPPPQDPTRPALFYVV